MTNTAPDKRLCVETEYAKIYFDNGIMVAEWKGTLIDMTTAKAVINSRMLFSDGASFPVLIKINSIIDSTKEARDYLASKEACIGMLAGAIVVDSIFESMLANLFIGRSKPVIPTKIFNAENKAKKWLEQFKLNN
ncbi:MAG: hypothetical protein V4608_02780 [Bacteroidota bacterium]